MHLQMYKIETDMHSVPLRKLLLNQKQIKSDVINLKLNSLKNAYISHKCSC